MVSHDRKRTEEKNDKNSLGEQEMKFKEFSKRMEQKFPVKTIEIENKHLSQYSDFYENMLKQIGAFWAYQTITFEKDEIANDLDE